MHPNANIQGSAMPGLIEQLQNIHLLSTAPRLQHNYALLRSVESLATEVAHAIGQEDAQILEAISPSSLHA